MAEDLTHSREQHSQVIVYLRDGPNCGSGIVSRRFLLDRNCRGKSLYGFHVGFFHLQQELSSVSRKGFNIPPLPLCKQCVKGQAGFPAPANSGDNHHSISRDLDIDPFEVVFARISDNDLVRSHLYSPRFFITHIDEELYVIFLSSNIRSRRRAAFSNSRLPAALFISSSSSIINNERSDSAMPSMDVLSSIPSSP